MATFFCVIGLEIKREDLAFRQAALPLTAAAGGALHRALYSAMTPPGPSVPGWGIPMATDIAFTLGILSLLGSRVPGGIVSVLDGLGDCR